MSIPRKPRSYDLEMRFTINGKSETILVNFRQCPVCYECTVFLMACSVCGRFSPNDRPVYFQIARAAPVSVVNQAQALDLLTPRVFKQTSVTQLPKKGEDDDGPKAS